MQIHKTNKGQLILHSLVLNIAELIEVEMSYQMWAGVLGKCLGINNKK